MASNLSAGSIKLAPALSTTTLPANYRRGYYETFNVAMERELPAQVTLQAAYVGDTIIREVPGININTSAPGGGTGAEVTSRIRRRR